MQMCKSLLLYRQGAECSKWFKVSPWSDSTLGQHLPPFPDLMAAVWGVPRRILSARCSAEVGLTWHTSLKWEEVRRGFLSWCYWDHTLVFGCSFDFVSHIPRSLQRFQKQLFLFAAHELAVWWVQSVVLQRKEWWRRGIWVECYLPACGQRLLIRQWTSCLDLSKCRVHQWDLTGDAHSGNQWCTGQVFIYLWYLQKREVWWFSLISLVECAPV